MTKNFLCGFMLFAAYMIRFAITELEALDTFRFVYVTVNPLTIVMITLINLPFIISRKQVLGPEHKKSTLDWYEIMQNCTIKVISSILMMMISLGILYYTVLSATANNFALFIILLLIYFVILIIYLVTYHLNEP